MSALLQSPSALSISESQFGELAAKVSNWGRWGMADELGTLNFIDQETMRHAFSLVKDALVVACGAPAPQLQAHQEHLQDGAGLHLTNVARDRWEAVNDRLTMDLHGVMGLTHLDALGHVAYDGLGYNGSKLAANFTKTAMKQHAIQAARNGIVGRGILLDLPRALGKSYMDAHEIAPATTVAQALARTGLFPKRGDILFIRTGAFARQARTGKMFELYDLAGVSISCAEWVHASEFSLLVTDVGMDPAPSEVENVLIPWHILCLSRMGLRLVNSANLEELAETCERLQRWEFLCTTAPLMLTGATSSPVSPLCFF